MTRAWRRIAFQGELGANSHEACTRGLSRTASRSRTPTFEEAFEAVKTGDCALGMIPVENSIAGRVADVHHLLPSSGPEDRRRAVQADPLPADGQPGREAGGREDRRLHADRARPVPQDAAPAEASGPSRRGDTAGAARMLAEHPDPTRAAISPALAAEIYGLDDPRRATSRTSTTTPPASWS